MRTNQLLLQSLNNWSVWTKQNHLQKFLQCFAKTRICLGQHFLHFSSSFTLISNDSTTFCIPTVLHLRSINPLEKVFQTAGFVFKHCCFIYIRLLMFWEWYSQVKRLPRRPLSLGFNDGQHFITLQRHTHKHTQSYEGWFAAKLITIKRQKETLTEKRP